MPAMPEADPWPDINILLCCEAALRAGERLPKEADTVAPYWRDLTRLLEVFRLRKYRDIEAITMLRSEMTHQVYLAFVD
jgi:thymidylate synthase